MSIEQSPLYPTLHKRVTDAVVEFLGVKPEEVLPTASLVSDLGADSLDLIELLMELEETFQIEVPDEDAEKWVTIGDVEAYLFQRKYAGE